MKLINYMECSWHFLEIRKRQLSLTQCFSTTIFWHLAFSTDYHLLSSGLALAVGVAGTACDLHVIPTVLVLLGYPYIPFLKELLLCHRPELRNSNHIPKGYFHKPLSVSRPF